MKRSVVILTTLLACATLSDGAQINKTEDFVKGVKLTIRMLDGDKSFDQDALTTVEATSNYLHGFLDCALQANGTLDFLKVNQLFAIPDGMTVGQLARVVDKYITDHPEQLHEPPGILCFNALLQAFPIKNPSIKSIHP